jgi:hypothetical protein
MANTPKYWSSLHGLTTLILVGAALYFLLVEHGNHTLPYLPYLIIFLCPLMHLFMHKGHNHEEHHSKNNNDSKAIDAGVDDGRKQSTKAH